MATCYRCGANLDTYLIARVSRQDSCPKCGNDIRCCKNCEFYEPNARWACREEITEHVTEKEKSTFCDFFKLSTKSGGSSGSGKTMEDLKSAAEALFKKK